MIQKFTVGEMARFHNLPKQTLIFYDKINLFKPKIVDSLNKYRYYTPDQFEVLDSICMLKEMGLSLNEIREFMENRNEETTIELLKRQKHILSSQISHLKLIEKRLDRKTDVLEHFINNKQEPITIKEEKKEYLTIEHIQPPGKLLETDLATKRLLDHASENMYPYYYQLGVLISKENLAAHRFTCASYAFLPLERNIKADNIVEKPAGLYALGYHTGTYEDIGCTYRLLLEEISGQGYSLAGYSYEYCILDSLTTTCPEDYVTAIHIHIRA